MTASILGTWKVGGIGLDIAYSMWRELKRPNCVDLQKKDSRSKHEKISQQVAAPSRRWTGRCNATCRGVRHDEAPNSFNQALQNSHYLGRIHAQPVFQWCFAASEKTSFSCLTNNVLCPQRVTDRHDFYPKPLVRDLRWKLRIQVLHKAPAITGQQLGNWLSHRCFPIPEVIKDFLIGLSDQSSKAISCFNVPLNE